MKIEMGKEYVTRSGRRVKILAVDVKQGSYPVVGVCERIKIPGAWTPEMWTEDGYYSLSKVEHTEDLIEVVDTGLKTEEASSVPEPSTYINKEGTYRTRHGWPVRILATDRKTNNRYTVAGLVLDPSGTEQPVVWRNDGRRLEDAENDLDLVPYSPWAEVPIDTPVICYLGEGSEEIPRYFAGLDKEGRTLAWIDGYTSRTTESKWVWKSMRLATAEELARKVKNVSDPKGN